MKQLKLSKTFGRKWYDWIRVKGKVWNTSRRRPPKRRGAAPAEGVTLGCRTPSPPPLAAPERSTAARKSSRCHKWNITVSLWLTLYKVGYLTPDVERGVLQVWCNISFVWKLMWSRWFLAITYDVLSRRLMMTSSFSTWQEGLTYLHGYKILLLSGKWAIIIKHWQIWLIENRLIGSYLMW